MNAQPDPALAARNRQAADEAARKRRNEERRRVVSLAVADDAPVEIVRVGRDLQEANWRDPDDDNPNRRKPKMVRGYRRIDTLARMMVGGTVTRDQAAAGRKLRDDYEIAGGAQTAGPTMGIAGSGSLGPGDVQLAALTRYRAAVQAMGKHGTAMVEHVVVYNRSLTEWSERTGRSVHQVTGYFHAALDRLVEHYGIGAEDVRRVGVG